ncbi:metal-dependent transcriptional regulator [Thermoflavifilum thermophilum]|uniref:Transcriptional regulator MntR n=1 Tax=Thermoflavifilum thermophilum TaxID=1393122 RepID=A0A1I7NHE7_9BACT|nr:metal-dependent transcriptional regulator [Thermoflavifilum thermophilum]SFV34069.1 iron (metal) dependent repressor, DtxR family [Thermoflavifilum thermophilum]
MKLTVAEENYIKAIYKLESQHTKATTNGLAAMLETSPAAVTDMANRLQKKKLISYEKYYGLKLTPSGKKHAMHIIRRHRLWECFLVEKLGFGWDEVHHLAEELEHIRDERLIERLAHFLQYPSFDPHGDPIPDAAGTLKTAPHIPLSHAPVQQPLKVSGVADQSAALLRFLQQKGIAPGTRLRVLHIYEYDGSVEIKLLKQSSFTLSQQVANNIYVQTYGKN